jgi:hypothetical protein
VHGIANFDTFRGLLIHKSHFWTLHIHEPEGGKADCQDSAFALQTLLQATLVSNIGEKTKKISKSDKILNLNK